MELSGIRYLDGLNVDNRRVFCRVDFNVPLDGKRVSDDTRIRAALPTIQALRQGGARVVLASHLGRPKGKVNSTLSLEPAVMRLAELLDDEVRFAHDCVGDGVEKLVKDLPLGSVAVLENLRFHTAEKAGDYHFAKLLAAPFDTYVNDAFGTSHRAHASMYTCVQFYKDVAAGLLVQTEVKFLGDMLVAPERPFVAVLGGAKVSDKIVVIKSLIGRCDTILIGGAMAYTLLAARGHEVGDSLMERKNLGLAKEILAMAQRRNAAIYLPSDHVIAPSIDSTETIVTDGSDIPSGFAGFDIGPKTRAVFQRVIETAGTVFWNGPMGVFERAPFAEGTVQLAQVLASSHSVSVVGGGDSAAAVLSAGVADKISHVSTGGGASLQFIEDRPLPGLEALRAGHRFPPHPN